MEELRMIDLIAKDRILADMRAATKEDALEEMARLVATGLGPGMQVQIHDALVQRERLASTGIGEEVAIPHGKLDQLPTLVAGLARSRDGIDFGAIDGRETRLFFVIVAPANANGLHLRALARVARLCREEDFRSRLLQVERSEQMHEILSEADARISVAAGGM
jgi:PTS system nitrogen regulatory IIA component